MSRILWFALVLVGCDVYDDVYRCQRDEQCVRPETGGGRCVAGACAFADPGCPAGLRFDPTAGDGRGGLCAEAPAPRATAAPFSPVPFPDGRSDVASLTLLFSGFGRADVYVAGWEGRPSLWRLGLQDGRGLLALRAPDAPAPLRAGVQTGSGLFVATKDQLYRSRDQGLSWDMLQVPGVLSLFSDGRRLYALTGAGLLSSGDDGQSFVPEGGAAARVVALFGRAMDVFAVGAGTDGGLLYRRTGPQAAWQKVYEGAPLLAGWVDAAGSWYAVGAGVLLRDGASLQPADGLPAQLEGTGAGDLWLRVQGAPELWRRSAEKWHAVVLDPEGTGCTGLAVAGESVVATSTYPGDRTYRSRLWRR